MSGIHASVINDDCPVCMSKLQSPLFIGPCGHGMCRACATEWLAIRPMCPICNQQLILEEAGRLSPPKRRAAQWQSQDPQTGEWVDYSKPHNAQLEAALHGDNGQCVIQLGDSGRSFIVLFGALKQLNQEGGARPVRRLVTPPAHVEWQSEDPETRRWVPYKADIAAQLEGAFDMGNADCEICLPRRGRFRVVLPGGADPRRLGAQVNVEGGRRPVRRHRAAPEPEGKPGPKAKWWKKPGAFFTARSVA